MTPLGTLIAARIAAAGPITVAEYMAECLLHPTQGYYVTRDPFGRQGDFTTAPEISQMFGELLGLALAQSWLDQGAPTPFTLAELGPGRGTLMADALRACKQVPGFHTAARIHLVEASPGLQKVQAETLAGYAPVWHRAVDGLPDQPLFLLANEFFDALPIAQFHRDSTGWRQRMVGLAEGKLSFGLSGPLPPEALGPRFGSDPPGTVVEKSPALPAIAAVVGARIARNGGAAIVVDYGGWRSKGDTLQAVRNHAAEHPLDQPGLADLTAHVDFEALALAMPLARTGLTDQGQFLTNLGIVHRANALAGGLTGAGLENHLAAHRRLTDPAEMGSVFKAIAFHSDGSPAPPGFAVPNA